MKMWHYFHMHCVFTEQQSQYGKYWPKWDLWKPLTKFFRFGFSLQNNLLWSNCCCCNPLRLIWQKKQTSLLHLVPFSFPWKHTHSVVGDIWARTTEQNKAQPTLNRSPGTTLGLCPWLTVWTEAVIMCLFRWSVSSLWEFLSSGICWVTPPAADYMPLSVTVLSQTRGRNSEEHIMKVLQSPQHIHSSDFVATWNFRAVNFNKMSC